MHLKLTNLSEFIFYWNEWQKEVDEGKFCVGMSSEQLCVKVVVCYSYCLAKENRIKSTFN